MTKAWPPARLFGVAAPALFVFQWSTGFVAARAAAPHGDLNLFVLLRFSFAAVILLILGLIARAPFPTRRQALFQFGCGALMYGVYVIASYWAVGQGLAVGVMTLLGALQPLFTAVLSWAFLKGRLGPRGWAGLAIGVAGVALVLSPALAHGGGSLTAPIVLAAIGGVLAMTVGALVQAQRASRTDIRMTGAIQCLGGAVVAALAYAAFGTPRWDGDPALWAALAWATLVLSVGGAMLLVWMARRDDMTKIAALLLLVPPLAAVEAYLLFGQTLSGVQIAGFVLALGGVTLTRSRRA